IEGLIQAVIDCRGKPVVMEATCGGRFPTTKFAEKLGIIKICRKYDVEFVDLNNDEEISKQVPEPAIFDRLTLSRRPLECDRLISIPVLKTHFNAGVSLGMKNYVGLLGRRAYAGNRGYTRGRFHNFARISLQHKKRVNQRKDLSSRHSKRFPSESLNLATVDLVAARPPDAVVISAVYGLESEGPVPGSPVDIKQRTGQYMVVAGYDPVAVDRIGADLMGASDDIARVLPLAAARGLGEMDREKIEIVGASFDELRCKFRMAFFID
ncbi:MAG: DUF362 domain-containing protein, partial [Phycisphaerae bacterium]|nr:DUF362 domain-containing protein [Phycisphaerae bacterium]